MANDSTKVNDQNINELLLSEFRDLKSKIISLENEVTSLKEKLVSKNSTEKSIDYTQIDGIVGIFDGYRMHTEDGSKFDVPLNYAAKSKLVYGDILKMIDKDGKKMFKHIQKVDRTKIDGILTKKEGEWYLLTDRGSYKVSDVAAEFQKAQLNSVATAFIPTEKLDAPFATIDEIEGFNQRSVGGKLPEKGRQNVKKVKIAEKTGETMSAEKDSAGKQVHKKDNTSKKSGGLNPHKDAVSSKQKSKKKKITKITANKPKVIIKKSTNTTDSTTINVKNVDSKAPEVKAGDTKIALDDDDLV